MAEKLMSNVHVDGKWYGPDYPENGDPPEGSVTNEAAYATTAEELPARELLEAAADPTRAGTLDQPAEETGDPARRVPEGTGEAGEPAPAPAETAEETGRGRRGGTR